MRKLYKTAYHTNPMLAENKITLASLYKILFEEEPLTLSDQCMQKLEESFHFLKTFSNDKIIYGINTEMVLLLILFTMLSNKLTDSNLKISSGSFCS